MKSSGYVTVAERPLDPADYPEADPRLLVPGSLVFLRTAGPVDLSDYRNWWADVPGASWRQPEGPGSDCRGRERHPVTHVAVEDALRQTGWEGTNCPPKLSGSARHAAASTTRCTRGGMNSRLRGG